MSFLKGLGIWVHGFSPVEIQMMARLSGLGLEGTIRALREAGLGSIPGGGAEVLVERVRKRIAPLKGGPDKWLEVMEAAHAVGMKTTGTMMFGITETLAERVEHYRVLREQQDRALARGNGGGHTAFVAWPFQSGHTVWEGKLPRPTDAEYLRTIAIARIYLDNFPHIQSSWVTMGRKTGQMALHYGCDDMGSLMLEENVVSAAGTCYSVNREEMDRMITGRGVRALAAGQHLRRRLNACSKPNGRFRLAASVLRLIAADQAVPVFAHPGWQSQVQRGTGQVGLNGGGSRGRNGSSRQDGEFKPGTRDGRFCRYFI